MASNTTLMREAWQTYLCISDHPDRRSVTILGRNAGWCPPEMLEPFEALSQALSRTGYRDAFDVWAPRKCPIGINGKKCRPDGTDCSLHNYGIAVDIDPPRPPTKVVRNGSANPHYTRKGHWKFGDIKLTRENVDSVRAIRTTAGARLFGWLGDSSINDTMHFEVMVPPAATRVDWSTVPGRRAPLPPVIAIADGRAATYIVQDGDTMAKIAARFNLTPAELITANPQISDPAKIFSGQVITLPGRHAFERPPPVAAVTYIVQGGDTMIEIAGRFDITTIELITANPQVPDPARIFPGQVLTIPQSR